MAHPQLDYHLRELDIAMRHDAPQHAMPVFNDADRVILDIGCGIGQAFVVARHIHDRLLVGIDVDITCEKWGHAEFPYIAFVNADGNRLPFADNAFDFVLSRVSLPYTNIPQALAEIARVLKPGGRIWLTLHPWAMARQRLKHAVLSFHAKEAIKCSYVIANGAWFHVTGRLFAWPLSGRHESFQTVSGMRKVMRRKGFAAVHIEMQGTHLVCSAHT